MSRRWQRAADYDALQLQFDGPVGRPYGRDGVLKRQVEGAADSNHKVARPHLGDGQRSWIDDLEDITGGGGGDRGGRVMGVKGVKGMMRPTGKD